MKRLLVLGFIILAIVGGTVEAASMIIKGRPATFRATSRAGETFEWVFPGNVKINGEIVQYTFREDGPQEVTLRVIAASGETNELTKSVMVHNMDKPTASIEARVDGVTIPGGVIRAQLGQKIDLKSRPFGVAGGDSGAFVANWRVNGRDYAESQVPLVFNRVGTYQVSLTIQDSDRPHLRDQDNLKVVIENQPPTVKSLTFTSASKVPGQINVKADASDPDGSIISYKFEILEQGRLFLSQVVREPTAYFDLSRYPGSHIYSFRVTVTDDRYATYTFDSAESFPFEKESFNTSPEARISVVPGNQGDVDTMFTFFAEASDVDKDYLRYEWNLQDGRKFYAPQFQYRFTEPGTQTVSVRVSDGIATVEESIVVSVVAKEVVQKENLPPKVQLKGILPSQRGDVNTVFRFYLTAEDPEADRLEYNWDMGDGGKMFIQNPAYRYKKPGKYKIKVRVSDGINEITGIADVIVDRIDQEKPPSLEEEALQKEVELLKAKTEALEKVKIAAPADTESIEEKISALSAQAEKAKQVSLERQKASREIALKEQERVQKQREELLKQLQATQEEKARLALERQIDKAEQDLEMLAKASAEEDTSGEINELERDLLENELNMLRQKIIEEQKTYLNEKINSLKEDQAKETDREKKFAIGLDIQAMQRYLASTDLLGEFAKEYKDGLLERKAELETRLSEAEDDQTKVLIQGQIQTIDDQLSNLDRLAQIQLDLARTQMTSEYGLDDETEFKAYLDDRMKELLAEKDALEQQLRSETDTVQAEVLKARLAEVQALLEQLGYLSTDEISLDDMPLVTAKQKINQYQKEVNSMVAGSSSDQAASLLSKSSDLKTQVKLLQDLDKSGLSPDMTVYDLRDQLETKKTEIVNDFRAEKDVVKLEALRSKILVLDNSLQTLSGLEDSGINEDNTLEEAQRILVNRRLNLTRTYVSSKEDATKKALLGQIQSVTRQQQLLEKFYDPNARALTIGNVKNDLVLKKDEFTQKLATSTTNDQKIFFQDELEEVDYNAVLLKRVENSLREIMKAEFEAELESHRASLLAELENVTDEEERAKLQAELDNLDMDSLKAIGFGQRNYFEGLIADMVISTNTKLFLYGQSVTEHGQAVFFEWDLDDGRVLTGQNINFSYRDSGFYRVKLNISDGLTESEDSLTIKVMPKVEEETTDGVLEE